MRHDTRSFLARLGVLLIICLHCSMNVLASTTPDTHIQTELKKLFTEPPQVTLAGFPYQNLLESAANRYDMPLSLVLAVVRGESFFDPTAESAKGAIGLMQIMPVTAKDYGVDPDALYDPAVNIDLGVHYLADLYAQLRDPYLAVAAYYCGCNGLGTDGITLREDCDEYVRYIYSHLQKILKEGGGGKAMPHGKERYFVLARFDNFLDAQGFLSFLSKRLPEFQFDIFRKEMVFPGHSRYQYHVTVTCKKEEEKEMVCRKVKEVTGFSLGQ